MLRVGAATVDITPPIGTRLAGQFDDRLMEDIHDPLSARALVLDDGETKIALVSLDLLSLKRRTVLAARSLIGQLTDIPPQNVLISATHTHGAPQVVDIFTRPPDPEYLAILPRQIATAVVRANRRLREAELGIASGREERASFNRRFLMQDGSIRMHASLDLPDVLGPEGPTDPEVGVLWASAPNGRVMSVLVNYTAHPTAVGHELAATRDWPGYLVNTLERVLGRDCVALFLNGAFGNVGPVGRESGDWREYGYRWAERTGTLVAAEALKVMVITPAMDQTRLRVASETVQMDIRPVTPEHLAWAGTQIAVARDPFDERIYAGELRLLAQEREQSASCDAEVQVIAIGEAAWVGIPGELFVEFGLAIKQQSPFPYTYIAGMANGCVGYIPTSRAFQHGGYETRLARSSKLIPEAGEQLVATAVRLLHRL